MKRKLFSILAFVLLTGVMLVAQPTYYSVIKNFSQPAPNQWEFDVLIKNTGAANFELTAFQLGLVVDNAIWNGGTASASLIAGSSEMLPSIVPSNINVTANVGTNQRNIKVAAKLAQPGQGQIMKPDSMKRYIRIRLQTSAASLAGLPANLAWEFQYYKTAVSYNNGGISTAFTNPASHFIEFGGGAPLTVNAPNGGESWTIGTNQNITWTADATVTTLKLEYTTNNGTSWTQIATNVPKSPASYSWTIPNTPSTQCKVKLTDVTTATLTDMSDNVFTIGVQQVCKDVTVAALWNLVSVPVVAANMTKTAVFPKATSSAYGFNEGYSVVDTLKNGVGYWLKFDSVRTMQVCGTLVPVNTVPVKAGWNLIGGYDKNVAVSAITTTPTGIISGSFYEYNDGYTIPSNLVIGKGYWIKVSQVGTLNLPSTVLAKDGGAEEVVSNIDPKWNKIYITDNANRTYTMYISDKSEQTGLFELPPAPPVGIFDVRYGTDKNVEELSTGKIIKIQGAEYPIRVRVEGVDLNVKDNVNGKIFNQLLAKGKEITISNPNINTISVSKVEIPKEFALQQNYPNPFNPTTTIRFAIPEKSEVKLMVFNSVGELVRTLATGEFDAGYHQVEFNASSLSSGVYYYQISAGNFRSVKKMLLVK